MTQEQIEAKALEEFPVEKQWVEYTPGFPEEEDRNEHKRAAFIKGCQYAATPSDVSREDAEKNNGLEMLHSNLIGRFILPGDRVRFEHWWAKATASLSPTQPDAETMKVLDECLQKQYSKTPTRLDESCPAQPGYSEWISAAESPKSSGEYLVVYQGPHKTTVATSFYYNADGWDRYKHNDYRVTHWMPLPSPPLNLKP